jgi:hypothetical protein
MIPSRTLSRLWHLSGTSGKRQRAQTRMNKGGAYRDRTGDLRLAKPALSQLS